MIEKIKVLFLETLMIAFGIVVIMTIGGIVAHIQGKTFVLQWYHPLSIVVSSVLCSLPFIFLFGIENMPKRKATVRFILHCLALYCLVGGLGYVFCWYSGLAGFIILSIEYFVIYGFVWMAMLWISRKDAKDINDTLALIRDDE